LHFSQKLSTGLCFEPLEFKPHLYTVSVSDLLCIILQHLSASPYMVLFHISWHSHQTVYELIIMNR